MNAYLDYLKKYSTPLFLLKVDEASEIRITSFLLIIQPQTSSISKVKVVPSLTYQPHLTSINLNFLLDYMISCFLYLFSRQWILPARHGA